MKTIKKIFVFLVFAFVLVVVGCGEEPIKLPDKIELEKSEVSLGVGDTYTVNPVDWDAKFEFKIEAIENDLVSIEGNVITAIKAGNIVVNVTLKDDATIYAPLSIYIKDKTVPEFEFADGTMKDVSINEGDAFDAKSGITAKDLTDGNITNKIEITGSVDSTKPGTYELTYKVVNSWGKEATLKRVITVKEKDRVAPTLTLKEGSKEVLELNWNTDYNPVNDVVAIDDVDGDITNNIVVKNYEKQNYGEQTITLEVSDAMGNKATLERKVKVIWNYAVKFIGHAGCYYGIMNTEEAFLNAAKVLKYQAIECDVKQTKDKVFVVCHDDTFGGKTLASTNYADLKNVKATGSRSAGFPGKDNYNLIPNGTGQYESTICTLERYLEICKEYGCIAVIELKSSNGITNSDQSRMQALMDLIEKCGMLEQTIFLGSQYNCLIWVKQHGYEYIPCQYLVNSFDSQTVYDRCVQYGLDVSINVTGDGITNSDSWLAKYKDAGIQVSTYTYTQYVDYPTVQEWIDKGVDFVTCDWHQMDKLTLPVAPDESTIVKHTVKFYDKDNNLIKTATVKDGKYAAAPTAPEVKGYTFKNWDKDFSKVTEDLEVHAVYEKETYTITYDANASIVSSSSWPTKADFVSDFYNDFFNWLVANIDNIPELTKSGDTYTLKRNTSANGTATFKNADDIKALNVYVFESALSSYCYKPVEGTNSATYVPVEDNGYFLNTEPYRTKYQGMNAYLLNCINTSYTSYSKTFNQSSNNRVQIFFRFHQWCNGTKIGAFDTYPTKYEKTLIPGLTVTLPTEHLTYTVDDEFDLPLPTSNATFVGWYLTQDCSGTPVTKIEKGSTGNIVLYAKWENLPQA